MNSVSPQDILTKIKSKPNVKDLKPQSSKRGLSQMFRPQVTEKKEENKTIAKKNTKADDIKMRPVERKTAANLKINKKKNKEIVRETSLKIKASIKIDKLDVSIDQFESFLKFTSKLYSHDYKLFFAILSKTKHGTIKDISINEQDIIDHGLRRGKDLKVSRENLENLKLISCREGYKSERSNRKSFFYSLANPNIS